MSEGWGWRCGDKDYWILKFIGGAASQPFLNLDFRSHFDGGYTFVVVSIFLALIFFLFIYFF
jgi:hypothetical protein